MEPHSDVMSTDLLQQRWKQDRCPIANGIVFGDGRLLLLALVPHPAVGHTRETFEFVEESSLDGFLKHNPDYWAFLTRHCQLTIPDADLLISAGGASMGGDGFVALSRASDDYLNWVLFSEDSNPFVDLAFTDGVITARTTSGDTWHIPIPQPATGYVIRAR